MPVCEYSWTNGNIGNFGLFQMQLDFATDMIERL